MLALLAAWLLFAPSAPQTAGAPGRVVGRVLIRGENQPVAGARVTLAAVRRGPLPPGSAPPGPPPQLLTGPDGVYTFVDVAPGEYRVNVQKTGLAEGPQTMQHTVTVVVTAGQSVQSPDIFLDRAGAIAGRILDSNGEPVIDVRVMALAPPPIPPQLAGRGYQPPANRPMLPSGHVGQTNDLGEFRIFGLLPGEYLVAASGQSNPFLTSTSATTVTTTYFPGVTDQASAQTISVAAGQTADGVEIRMATAPAFLISGVVVDTEGRPLEGAGVSVMSTTAGIVGPHGISHTDERGRFLIGSLPNGIYRIGVASSNVGPGATMRLPEQLTITVADANIAGLRLVLVPR